VCGEAAAARHHWRAGEMIARVPCGWRSELGPGACALERGGESAARQGRSATAVGAACALEWPARAGKTGRARERERGERKRVERERESQHFDLIQTQNFPWELEKF